MSHDPIVAKRPRGTAVLHALSFPVPIFSVWIPVFAFFAPLFKPWGPYATVAILCYFAVLYARCRSVRLLLREDAIEVRNLLKTTAIPVRDVRAIEWGRVGLFTMLSDRCLDVVTTDGRRIHIQSSVSSRVKRNAAGEVESRFEDSAVRTWAREHSVPLRSESEAFAARAKARQARGRARQ